jgi:hypothetical protein
MMKSTTTSIEEVAATGDSGSRFNAGKLPLHLISPYATEGLARVLGHGQTKYAARNWEKGLSWSETIASMERHILEIKKGNDFDNGPGGSGLPHVHHIQCNAMFLAHFFETKTGTDDRPKTAPRQYDASQPQGQYPAIPQTVGAMAKAETKCHLKLPDVFGACGAVAGHSSTNPRDVTCPACLSILYPGYRASDYPKTVRPSPNHTKYEHGSIWASQGAWEVDMIKRREQNDAVGFPGVEEIARFFHSKGITE